MFHNLLERTNNLLVLSSFCYIGLYAAITCTLGHVYRQGDNTLHHVYRQGDGNVEVQITISIT